MQHHNNFLISQVINNNVSKVIPFFTESLIFEHISFSCCTMSKSVVLLRLYRYLFYLLPTHLLLFHLDSTNYITNIYHSILLFFSFYLPFLLAVVCYDSVQLVLICSVCFVHLHNLSCVALDTGMMLDNIRI